MKSIDLENFKAAWKKERSFDDQRLSEEDIQRFLSKKSKDISQLFKMGLVIDIFLKILIGVSFLGIIFLFRDNLDMIIFAFAIILGLIWATRYQWSMIRKIPRSDTPDPVIRTSLEKKIRFYHQKYFTSLYVGAFSNALLILSGMLYYFYFKYGEIRPFQWDDYLVFSLVLIIGFGLGATVQIAQYRFQIRQLESCLQEIDEEAMTALTIREQRNKKRRMVLAFVLALICGLLILGYFIFQ